MHGLQSEYTPNSLLKNPSSIINCSSYDWYICCFQSYGKKLWQFDRFSRVFNSPCPQIEIQESGSAKCVIITPNFDVPVKFGWNKFESTLLRSKVKLYSILFFISTLIFNFEMTSLD